MRLAFHKGVSSIKRLLAISFYFFLLYFFIILFQTQIDNAKASHNSIEDMKYLPSGQFLKGAALAYDELLADFLWIKAVMYFGEHYQSDKNYQWLYHLVDTVTTLDPYFHFPYEFGGIALGFWIGNADYSIKILKKGMINVPKTHKRYWTIPFYLGFDYMYYKKDFLAAARFLEEATKYPGHPRYIPKLVSRLYVNAKDPEIAISFLNEILSITKDETVKKDLEKRIKEVIVERDIQKLEQARDLFKKKNGFYPGRLEDLVTSGFMKEIPHEPFGGKYIIKGDASIFSSQVPKRMKVYIK
jgi:hypothetical protein